jgi:hypothetical protein
MAMRDEVFSRHDVCFSGLGTSLTMKYAKAIGAYHLPRENVADALAHGWGDPRAPLELFDGDVRASLRDPIRRRMLAMLEQFPDDLPSHQLWDLHANAQRVAKWYPNGMRVSGRGLPFYAPLCDRDFSLLGLRLPWSIKAGKGYPDSFLQRCWPKLACLPTTYTWPERPWPVKVCARLPRALSAYAYDRRRLWPARQRLPLASKPVEAWVGEALPPHISAIHDFIEREMTLPLSRKAVARVFHGFESGDSSQFKLLASLIPLLLADGFRFDERTGLPASRGKGVERGSGYFSGPNREGLDQ